MFNQAEHLFTFAIISDTHVKPESGDQSAPWKVNELATGRARWISCEIARYNPSFVIHLGDLVHPVPELPTFDEAVSLTKQVFRAHHNALHVLPGNHDIGDKPNRMMPAKSVRNEWIKIHENNFGPSWSSFDTDTTRMILINNPVLNSGSPIEQEQRAWLEATLASAGGKRIFVFMHYPLFLLSPSEAGNYDNIDEPARSDLLDLVKRYGVEAVFAGHVHNIFYHRIKGTEFYVMPATSFVRQDFSEMFRIEAAAENGRNDAEKLGFALVDVYQHGHVVHYLRSYGQTIAADTLYDGPEPRSSVVQLPHPKKPGGAPFGVFLRHPWTEVVTLPHNGPMDEFQRKQARNDYPLAALWQLGIHHARIPLADLVDDTTRQRVADLVAIGHRFTVFGFDVPQGDAKAIVLANSALIDRYEVVLPRDAIIEKAAELERFRHALGRPVLLSPVATSADQIKVGSKIELFVSHGFRPADFRAVDELLKTNPLRGIDGFVFRLDQTDDLSSAVESLSRWSRASGRKVDCHLRLAANNPARNLTSETDVLARVTELFALGLGYPDLGFMVDTFMDIDRGYFVRSGLIDRRCNLTMAGHAIEALSAHLGTIAGTWLVSVTADGDERVLRLEAPSQSVLLVLGDAKRAAATVQSFLKEAGVDARCRSIPLGTPWTIEPHNGIVHDNSGCSIAGLSGPILLMTEKHA
ncbi:MAG TPA: metallophosphoesterase [Afipia sp.]